MVTPHTFGRVTVLVADNGGVLPYGNSVVVRGSEQTLIIDPSLALERDTVAADLVFLSHGHEDHIAGLRHFDAPTYAHHLDVGAVASLDALVAQFGLPPAAHEEVTRSLRDEYGIPLRRDGVIGVADGHVFELGDVTATIVHLPGHTPGHCGVLVEPEGFLYVGDIDLTSFGPMYGDVHSSVEDFLASIDRVAATEARWYGTFHHKGVIEGADAFRERLGAYRATLFERERRLLRFLDEPRSIEDIVAHRLLYRPHVSAPYVDVIERRVAQQHLERLVTAGDVAARPDGTFVRTM
ncbi:MBL fold metallo-hydrolase [Nocardia cyriacigeorgica]|uniref:MBL fold metallo-hydrolase n=1 Tax=Nocardia cyriacigeorgica TaxID=135487 RepID=UPI00245752A0|nr:MBL fold metallo-hydrolase [Nocardia cyriacigeorgica]